MKYLIISLLAYFVTIAKINAQACHGCGPSSGCNYVGVLPQFQKNFIGLRWNDRSFKTRSVQNTDAQNLDAQDRFSSAEIWGRVFLHRKLQLIGILPFAMHNRFDGNSEHKISGLGDAVMMLNYSLFSTSDSSASLWSHNVQIGGGVKLPTGNFRNTDGGLTYHPNFQIGTGSLDFIGSTIYTIRYQKLGFRTEAGYKYNTLNASTYRFGDRISNNNTLFYWGKIEGNNAFVPQIGLYQELAMQDVSQDYFENNTGGTTRMLTAGIDFYYSKIAFGATFMRPVQQPKYIDLPLKMLYSYRLHLSYYL